MIPRLSGDRFAEGEYAPGSPAQPTYYGVDQPATVRRAFQSTTSAPAYAYDPYGNPLQATTPVTDFNYAGMFTNADSSLDLTQYRVYNPVIGRRLSRDPLGEASDPAANLYRYVEGNPVSLVDPQGTGPLGFAIGLVAGAAAASEGGPLATLEAGVEFARLLSAIEDALSGNSTSSQEPTSNPANYPQRAGQPPVAGTPRPTPNFISPTNPAQAPPTNVPGGGGSYLGYGSV